MPISIDIDGVITRHLLPKHFFSRTIEKAREAYHHKLHYSDIEQLAHKAYHYPMQMVPNAKEAIEILYAKSYPVILNSSRPRFLESVTDIWLKRYGFSNFISTIHLRNIGESAVESKLEGIAQTHATIHIDDDPEVIAAMEKMPTIQHIYFVTKDTKEIIRYSKDTKVTCVPSLHAAVFKIVNPA